MNNDKIDDLLNGLFKIAQPQEQTRPSLPLPSVPLPPPPTPVPASSSLSISAKSAATTAAAKVAHRQEMGGGEGGAAQWAHSLRRRGGRGERSSALGLLPPSLDVRSQPADRRGRPPMCVSCCVAFPAHSYSMYTCMHRSACNE